MSRPRELQSVQALRALAATSVIFDHIGFMGWGAFGVDVFFVVSGFIICYISSLSTKDFLVKRLFRILPLYWAGTLGVFAVALFWPRLLNSTTANGHFLLKSLFFIPYLKENGTTTPVLFLGWTLEYEMFFYLLFAAVLAWTKKRATLAIVLVLGVIAVAGRAFQPSSIALAYYSKPLILEFAFGAIAFMLWNRYQASLEKLPVLLALGVSAVSYFTLFLCDKKILGVIVFENIPRFVLRGTPAFLLFICFLSLEGRVRFPRWVLAIGDASYSLYLFHPYVIQMADKMIIPLDRVTPARIAVSVLAILVCFAVALLSFRLFERPSNEYLRRVFLKSKTPQKRAAAAAAGGWYRVAPETGTGRAQP